jgi:molybdopterin biosynthesis enzyme
MPGNAVAAYVIYQLVAAPLLARRAGARAESPVCLELPLAGAARTTAGRIDWRRGCFVARNGRAAVELLAQQGSSMLHTLSRADALVGIGPRPEIPDGEPVPVIPLAALP